MIDRKVTRTFLNRSSRCSFPLVLPSFCLHSIINLTIFILSHVIVNERKRRNTFMSIRNLLPVIASLTTLLILTNHASVVVGQGFVQDSSSRPGDRSVFQYNRGGLISTIQYLKLDQSPFNFYEDVIVSKSGKLVIQEGVVVNFAPRKGLFVQGSLVAVVSKRRRNC